jgi:hypothetical protein
MLTTDELFQMKGEVNSFHDAVFEATGKSMSDAELKEVFLSLTEQTRNIAHAWGLSDTPFRDEAYTELKRRP